MNKRRKKEKKSGSKIFIFLVTFVCIFLCVFLSVRGRFKTPLTSQTVAFVLSPFQQITSWFGTRFNYVYETINEIETVHEENQRLKAENEKLKAENQQSIEYAAENDRLRALVGYRQAATQFDLIISRVIGYESAPWSRMIVIDRGTSNGIQTNMAVVTEAGLVGHVTEAGINSSKVQLIIDPRSSVGTLIQRPTSRVVGIVEGDPNNPSQPKMSNVPKDADMNENDIVVTSGFGGVYPKGLIVGRIESIHPDVGGLLKYGIIDPAVNFQKLEDVAVIVESREAPPEPIKPTDNQIVLPEQPTPTTQQNGSMNQ